MERIEADLLIPGRGTPLRDGVIVLDGAAISYAGPALEAPATPGARDLRAALDAGITSAPSSTARISTTSAATRT